MTLVSLKRHIDRKFATKVDLRRFATKDDLAALERRMDVRFGQMMRQFESMGAKFDAVSRSMRDRINGHEMVLDEHERRLQDIERSTLR